MTYRERELATVSVLAGVGGVEPMAYGHMSICLHLGITPEQLTALLNIVEINLGKKSSDPLRDVLGQLTDKNESEEYEEDFIISIINTRVWNGRCPGFSDR